jgi:hypothetical protein
MRNSYDEKELQLMSYPLHKKRSMYLFKMNIIKIQKIELGVRKIKTILKLWWNKKSIMLFNVANDAS